MIVGMGEVLKKDSSINKVLSIPEGFFASRENSRSEWIIEGFEEDEE